MFEVDVKNVTQERRGGEEGRRRGPARVWGSDEIKTIIRHKMAKFLLHVDSYKIYILTAFN